jgi:hypothetical protein
MGCYNVGRILSSIFIAAVISIPAVDYWGYLGWALATGLVAGMAMWLWFTLQPYK